MRGMRRAALLSLLALVVAGCGGPYDSRPLERSLPHYPGAAFVSRDASCGPGTSGGTVCGSESIWRMRGATDEQVVDRWFARHLPGWSYLACGTGFTKGHAYVDVATPGRSLSVYADAHGAAHCDDVPSG